MKRLLISIFFIAFAAAPCAAQWKALGLNPDDISALAVHDTNLFIAAYNAYVLRYAPWDTPYHVVIVDNGIYTQDRSFNSFTSIGENLFVGVFMGANAYRSTNNGASWTLIYPHDSIYFATNMLALASSDTILFAGTNIGLFRSTDYGISWKRYLVDCSGIATSGDTILSSDFVSVDRGLTWKRIGPDPSAQVAIIGTTLFAGTHPVTGFGRVYRSTNFGLTWDSVLDGGWGITAFAKSGGNLFVATGGFETGNGVYLSTDLGAHWAQVGLNNIGINCLTVQDTMLWAGSPSELYYRPIAQMIGKDAVREMPPAGTELTIYPNPAATFTTITYSLSKPGIVNITIIDALGRTIAVPVVNESQNIGTFSIDFDGSRLPAGVYWCRLSTGSDSKVGKFVIGR